MASRPLKFSRRAPTSLFTGARRNPPAFHDVYVAYHEQVLTFFARQTFDPDVAFDLMAETFAEMFAALPRFRGETEEQGLAWMWAIARHQLYRWRERGRVERRNLGRLFQPLGPEEYLRIEELADLDRLLPHLAEAMARLSEDHREALRLRIVEHRSYEDMAALLGIRVNTARARVSRGLRTLAADLNTMSALETPEATIEEMVT